jgi:hypothetical protein
MSETEKTFLLNAAEVRFRRDEDGRVQMLRDGGSTAVSGLVAAFPLSRRRRMIAVRDREGREIGILDDTRQLDDTSQAIVRYELERSYFMPRILDVLDIEENLSVVEWQVETDKGPRRFQARGVRKNIRRVGRRRLVIKDVDGNRYEIPDWTDLPAAAQRLIEPYLWG